MTVSDFFKRRREKTLLPQSFLQTNMLVCVVVHAYLNECVSIKAHVCVSIIPPG